MYLGVFYLFGIKMIASEKGYVSILCKIFGNI